MVVTCDRGEYSALLKDLKRIVYECMTIVVQLIGGKITRNL